VVVKRPRGIDELALATVVRDARPAGAGGIRPTCSGRGRHPALLQPAAETGAPLCPGAIRYRTESEASPAAVPGTSPWHFLTSTATTRGLVIEVHLLPALTTAGDNPRTLAALDPLRRRYRSRALHVPFAHEAVVAVSSFRRCRMKSKSAIATSRAMPM
jgi:hypothetical protein